MNGFSLKKVSSLLNKIYAFTKKDFLIFVSYKLYSATQLLDGLATILVFYFISKLIGPSASGYLKPYGGEYFPFVVVGLVFSSYLSTALTTFSQSLRNEQMAGTLEAIFTTPTNSSTILMASATWSFIFSSITVFIYLGFGLLFFNFSAANINLPAMVIIVILTFTVFSSIGMISGGFIMLFKMGNPINWVIKGTNFLLGGVFFPIEVLPAPLRTISLFLPTTYSLRSLRRALFNNAPLAEFFQDISMLVIFCIILLPVSFVFFGYAVNRVREEGRLSFY